MSRAHTRRGFKKEVPKENRIISASEEAKQIPISVGCDGERLSVMVGILQLLHQTENNMVKRQDMSRAHTRRGFKKEVPKTTSASEEAKQIPISIGCNGARLAVMLGILQLLHQTGNNMVKILEMSRARTRGGFKKEVAKTTR